MTDKMAAVEGKVTAFVGLTKESLDGASYSLDGDREIKRRLIGRHNISPYAIFYAGLSCCCWPWSIIAVEISLKFVQG